MEDIPSDPGKSEAPNPNTSWWPSDLTGKLRSVSLMPEEQNLGAAGSASNAGQELSPRAASQILWSTGTLSSPIPNGFYSIIPDKKLKELFDTIPSPEDLNSFGIEGLKAEIILVDADKDKKLSMLKQLSAALVKGLSSNPASLIKKLAGLVSDFYKRPNPQLSPAKATAEEIAHLMENRGIQLLGQIRHGSCRPRAILFKVLADSVGLESKLVVGLPGDESVECTDSDKHMSVVVVLNSVELLVDLMRFPGQLVPFSAKAIFTSHISAAGESDSADYDSCDSPLEPNSPLCGFYERIDGESQELDENARSLGIRRTEASNVSGPSLRNIMLRSASLAESKLSLSHSEPNITNAFWGRSRSKVVADQQRTASSSPEHPLSRVRGRSMLSGDRHSFRDYADGVATSRSDGASTSNTRRARRRSISITPEIGDDIVRAVRAMNETMKQNRLLRDQNDGSSHLDSKKEDVNASPQNVAEYDLNINDESSSRATSLYNVSRRQITSQKAISLPSSPHEFSDRNSELSTPSDFLTAEDLMSTWNKVLRSSPFLNKPLLPFEEWHIDFSELTVGTRVGIGFFGEVFRGIWNGTDVAIKVFLEQDLTAENMEDFCNEISILSRLRHPNVILFLGACMRPPHLSLVTEYMEMGSLYYLIHMSGQKKKLNWRRRLKMLRDICRGLMCMHRMKIVHRDLKSANCLVNRHWTVKICDFGLSRAMTGAPMSDNSSAGTPEWMAPELMRNEPFTEKCDIFSLGVIMWELCTLNRPWEGKPSVQVVYSVANEGARLKIPDGPLGCLISDCWAESEKRPNCQEILTRLLDCEYTLC
ncbi:serine/threonine-protein kinase EDR1-like isoform X1 [Ananas comosus]|uniref:non-specific serine/threonine protein kinase n=1 Tax=Ananas comosus TaxID=4615 RepID=A0A6P5EYN5_ANACO|nr:serine/threonine-protein kinase EDR1-like isoform X1 [Ananas comosus]XP_020088665.1 serine/threonine-protein kinase EDR1-like isoform X1 [Ananas comosus]